MLSCHRQKHSPEQGQIAASGAGLLEQQRVVASGAGPLEPGRVSFGQGQVSGLLEQDPDSEPLAGSFGQGLAANPGAGLLDQDSGSFDQDRVSVPPEGFLDRGQFD
jgi:hypothetical protein